MSGGDPAMMLMTATLMMTLATAPADGWIPLFNGKDLGGWTAKVVGHPLDRDPYQTVQVEDGMIRIDYDNYEGDFDGRFHLFHVQPFSRYRCGLNIVPGRAGPGRSGLGLAEQWRHAPAARARWDCTRFPVSIEGQLLGGDGTGGGRPATSAPRDPRRHERATRHGPSTRRRRPCTFQWVTAEFEVDGNGPSNTSSTASRVVRATSLDPSDPDAQAI